MDELTRITHGHTGYTVTAIDERGTATHERVLAQGVTRDDAITALWDRGLTPTVAAESLNAAVRLGRFTVAALTAA